MTIPTLHWDLKTLRPVWLVSWPNHLRCWRAALCSDWAQLPFREDLIFWLLVSVNSFWSSSKAHEQRWGTEQTAKATTSPFGFTTRTGKWSQWWLLAEMIYYPLSLHMVMPVWEVLTDTVFHHVPRLSTLCGWSTLLVPDSAKFTPPVFSINGLHAVCELSRIRKAQRVLILHASTILKLAYCDTTICTTSVETNPPPGVDFPLWDHPAATLFLFPFIHGKDPTKQPSFFFFFLLEAVNRGVNMQFCGDGGSFWSLNLLFYFGWFNN